MDKDPALRANRLAQLRQITALLGALGDFGRLPVQAGLTKGGGEHNSRGPATDEGVPEEGPDGRQVRLRFSEGNKKMKELLGGKGANLAEMTNIGLPVPPGFTITHRGLQLLLRPTATYPDGLDAQVEAALAARSRRTRARSSATPTNPLLVSRAAPAPAPRCRA